MINRNLSAKFKAAANRNMKERDYWLKRLACVEEIKKSSFPPDLDLKSLPNQDEHTTGMCNGKNIETVSFQFPHQINSKLMERSNHSDYVMHIYLVAGLVLLLNRYTGITDIIVGTPIYRQDMEGELINRIVALRNRLEDNMTVKDLLLQVKQTIAEDIENQNYPIEMLPEQLKLAYDEEDFPLFDTAILIENIHDKEYLKPINHNMTFSFTRKDNSVVESVNYNSRLYRKPTIESIVKHFIKLLQQVLYNLDSRITDLEMMSEEERRQILLDCKNKKIKYPNLQSSLSSLAVEANHAVFLVLDRSLNLCPVNVEGELYIASPGFAEDYLNLSTLTTGKLVENPYAADIFGTGTHNQLMYKTWDLVRRLPDGTIELLGKIDQQGKPDKKYTAPRNRVERKLVEIWGEILGVKKETISIDDNFFESGGHSLKAMELVAKIHKKLNAKITLVDLFENPAIRGLAKKIKKLNENKYVSIEPVEKRDYYPLTLIQEKIFLDKTHEKGTRYNITGIYMIEGKLDKKRFIEAVDKLVQRHEIFRASFHFVNGKPVQKINYDRDFKVNFYICDEEQAKKRIEGFKRPFDLSQAPLIRVELLQVENEKYFFFIDMHHIISDGISKEIIFDEIIILYNGKKIKSPTVQFKDYVVWYNNMLAGELIKKQERYWLKKMNNFKFTQLPVDEINYSNTKKFDKELLKIEKSFFRRIETFCSKYKVTKFTFLIAIFQIILAREIGQKDITIGARISVRDHYDLKKMIGCILNKVVIRSIVENDDIFLNHLSKINKTVNEAMDNALYPCELLTKKILEENNLSNNEIFAIKVNYLPPAENVRDIFSDSIKVSSLTPPKRSSKYNVALTVKDFQNELGLHLYYNCNIYHKKRMKGIMNSFVWIITRVLKNVNIILTDLFKEENNDLR